MKSQIVACIPEDQSIEILPPERRGRGLLEVSACICCGRRSHIDEDGCGICDDCLAPDGTTYVAINVTSRGADKSIGAEFIPFS